MSKKKRLLIIPAKSKSQRVKGKNFKNFYGKLIIEYPYKAAEKSKLFDKIHISTESNQIRKKLIKKKIEIDFLRDKNLVKKNTTLFEVYKFVVKEYKKRNLIFDEIWSLLPCSPLINFKDLRRLCFKIEKEKLKKPIISVCQYNAPIEWAFKKKKDNLLVPINKKKQNLPSQSFQKKFYDVGVLSVFDKKNFKTKKKYFPGNFYGFELPFEKSVDIDSVDDWEFAKKLFKK